MSRNVISSSKTYIYFFLGGGEKGERDTCTSISLYTKWRYTVSRAGSLDY